MYCLYISFSLTASPDNEKHKPVFDHQLWRETLDIYDRVFERTKKPFGSGSLLSVDLIIISQREENIGKKKEGMIQKGRIESKMGDESL